MSALLLVPCPAEAEDVCVSGQAWKEYWGLVNGSQSWEPSGTRRLLTQSPFGERDFSHTELNVVTSARVE